MRAVCEVDVLFPALSPRSNCRVALFRFSSLLACVALLLSAKAGATTYTVTAFTDTAANGPNTGDGLGAGVGSGTSGDLRYVILAANAAGGTNTIHFSCASAPCTNMLGEAVQGQAQEQPQSVVHKSDLRRSGTTPSGASAAPALVQSRTVAQPDLTPVNTGTGIVYVCDPSVASATCTYLNTVTAGHYNSTFTNANANIYVEYVTGINAPTVAGSLAANNYVTYAQYVQALTNNLDQSPLQSSALMALDTYDVAPYGSSNVVLTSALGAALGFSGTGLSGIDATGHACNIGDAGCYDGLIEVNGAPAGFALYYDNLGGAEPSNAYDFYALWNTKPMRCLVRPPAFRRRVPFQTGAGAE